MFLNAIDPSAAESLLPSVQKELALLASGLDGRFLEAGTTLATAVETIDRVIAALDGVTSALDERAAGAAVRDLGAVAAKLTTLPATQATRDHELSAVAIKTKLLREQVMVMHQTLQVLRIYGVNVKIAASGAEEFVGFIDRMTTTLGAGQEELGSFLSTLKDVDGSLAGAQQALRILATECTKVVPSVPRRLASDAIELQAHLATVAEAAVHVSTIAREIQGRVAIVLGALQVGDRTRQRLEHVVSAMQMLDTRHPLGEPVANAAVGAHIGALLAAQLDATADDFDADSAVLLAALTALGPDTARLLALIEQEESGSDGRTFLHRLEQGITEVERLTSQLYEADQRSGAMLDTIAAALEALAARLDNLRSMRLDVQNIAVNTRLMSNRFGAVGKAVSVIASEVDASAKQLGSALDHVIWPIRELGQLSLAMREAQRSDGALDAGAALARSLDIVRDGCRRTERGVGQGRDDAQQIIALIEGVTAKLSDELALGGHIRTAARLLTAAATPAAELPAAADPPTRALLGAIGSLYTMAQEREVHAAFLLPGMEPIATAAPSGDGLFDDDDDGLF